MSRNKRSKSAAPGRRAKARRGAAQEVGQKRKPKVRWIGAIAIAAIAVIAVAVGREYVTNWQAVNAATEDARGEVITSEAFRAVHEMKDGPPVPFLPAGQPQPRIEVPTVVHDFGSIAPKAVVTYTFLIRNAGAAPLTISRAFTTCGCTTAVVSARVIPPGKAASVGLRFDAGFHDTRGQQVKRGLVIESNDRRNWKTTVWTRASVRHN